ncbi:MAG: hypothetical protein H6815_12125 [Phycisphaeraceae bacterium]|nr:hypothetical protein [Phycisphaerales bacterium]MCB9861187.1 hypothetical protein [Phycisphaeraceae bacterium]
MKKNQMIAGVCAVVGLAMFAHAQGVQTFRGGKVGPDRSSCCHMTARVHHNCDGYSPCCQYVAPLSKSVCDAAAQYGNKADPKQTIVVGRGVHWFEISPWEPAHPLLGKHIERQRLEWLRCHGFVGGIKTVTNPGVTEEPETTASSDAAFQSGVIVTPAVQDTVEKKGAEKEKIQPRAIFRVPEGVSRETPTFRV